MKTDTPTINNSKPAIISIFLLFSLSLLTAQDTVIFDQSVLLSADLSGYENVEIAAVNDITFSAGFYYSSDATGTLSANADIYSVEEPQSFSPYGSFSDSLQSGTVLNLNYPVGTIPGMAGVSPSGGASYSLPFELPPGNNGFVPELGIQYNSRTGSSLLGHGWMLSGLSSITASGKSYYYDGMKSLISDQDSACRLYWDGQRLFGINHPGLDADSFYTEIKSDVIIEKVSDGGNSKFRIKTADGRTLVYGGSENSKMNLDTGTQWIWMLDTVYNRIGGKIIYTYTRDAETKEIFLSEVQYGGDVQDPVNEIAFHYTDRADISYSYIHNYRIVSTRILDSVVIKSGNQFYGGYGFAYENGSGESLLKGITWYDKDQYRYNSTLVDWELPDFDINEQKQTRYLQTGDNYYNFTGDFTGDGISDLVAVKLDFYNNSCMYYLYKGTPDGLPSTYDQSGPMPRSYTHLFWDELKDFVEDSCTSGLTPANVFTGEDISYVFSGDFDGDGVQELLVKVVEWEDMGDYLPSDLNSGFEATFADGFGGFEVCGHDFKISDISKIRLNYGLGRFMNFNSNGTVDNVHTKRLGLSLSYKKQYSDFPDIEGRGYNSFPDQNKIKYFDPVNDTIIEYCELHEGEHRWGDFNGDGFADYIDPDHDTYSFDIYILNPQQKSYSKTHTIDGYFLGTIDLNSDGTDAYVYYKKKFNTQTYSELWTAYCPECNIMDSEWWNFLEEYDLSSLYIKWMEEQCDTIDNITCRQSYLQSGAIQFFQGYEVFIKHYQGVGQVINLGFFNGEEYPSSPIFSEVIAADINSDDKDELLLYSSSQLVRIYYNFIPSYNNGIITYTKQTKICNDSDLKNAKFGDFNGDGHITMISPSGGKEICYTSGKPGRLVRSVTNGMGRKTEFIYKPLTNNSVYTRQSNAEYPVIDYSYPVYVVSSLISDNGAVDDLKIDYTYEGLKIHTQGKGNLGFMQTTQTNSLTNEQSIITRSYNNQYFYPFTVSNTFKIGSSNISSQVNKVRLNPERVKQFSVFIDTTITVDHLNAVTVTSSYNYTSGGKLSEKKTETDNTLVTTERYSYTGAGWFNDYLLSERSVQYNRDGVPDPDSVNYSYSYQAGTGLLTSVKKFCGTDQEQITRYSEFDSFGNPKKKSIIARSGLAMALDSLTERYTYSSCGRFVTSHTDPSGMTSYFNYNAVAGLYESVTLANGLTTQMEYGPFGRRVKEISPDLKQQVNNRYWSFQHPDAPETSVYLDWSSASGEQPTYTFYDIAGRPLRTVSHGFAGDKIYTDKQYDSSGRLLKSSLPFRATGTAKWTDYMWDAKERIIEELAPDGTVVEYQYDALKITTTVTKYGISQSSETLMNPLRETIQSKDNLGNIVYYTYSPNGKVNTTLTSVSPNDTVKFEYDVQGNRTFIADPDAGEVAELYDGFGRLHRQIDAGDTTTYEYDNLGRLTRFSGTEAEINYAYISDTTSKAFGQVDSIYNTAGTLSESYTYDNTLGRLTGVTRKIPDKTFTNSYSYDWFGRLQSRTYPTGFQTGYSYNSAGHLEKITGAGRTLWQCNEVDDLGQVTQYAQGNYNTAVTYDDYGRLSRTVTGSVQDFRYGFDAMGNLEFREDYLTSQKEVFEYDNLNRLTGIDYYLNSAHITGADFSIVYSDAGNITSKTDVGPVINYGEAAAGPHALTSIEEPVVAYQPPPQAISYTSFNKVSNIQDTLGVDSTLSLSFTYGLNNQRVKTVQQRYGSIERIRYFGSDYQEDSTAAGTKKYHYIHAPTGLIGIFVKEGSADTMYHVLTDHLGSLTTVINAETNQLQRYSYSSWGMPRDSDDWTSRYTGELFAGRGFTGHEHLQAFDLINMNGRVYDPVLARFLSPDPFVQFPGAVNGFNRYSYVMNNPLLFTDPSGYMPNWVQDEYNHYYRNSGGDDRRNEGGGSGWNPFGWISRSMNIGGWTKNPGDYWHYSPVSGTYYNSETGERRQANNESTKSVLNDAGGTIYGIYEIAYSLDYGENFIRTGKYRMIKEGTMKSNGMFPTFAANGGVEPGLSFDQVADDIRRNGENRFIDYASSPHYGGGFFVNAAENYSPQNFQNWKLAPGSVNFGRKVGRWGHQYFPNPNYGELRHIIGSYVIAEKYDPLTAYNVTWGNEYIGLSLDIRNLRSRLNGSEWAFQYSDVFNNYKGIWYSLKY